MRKKIKWEKRGPDSIATVGCVNLECWELMGNKFSAHVNISYVNSTYRRGPYRKTMDRAKEDAVRIARELLEDYQVAIDGQMKTLQGMEI